MFNRDTEPFYRFKAAAIITLAIIAWDQLDSLQNLPRFLPQYPVSSSISHIFEFKSLCHSEHIGNFQDDLYCVATPTFDLLEKNATILQDGGKILTSS